MKTTTRISALALGISALLIAVSPAQAQVTFFKKPPTADQLRQALTGKPAPVRRTSKTRGIVWNKSAGQLPTNQPQQVTGAAASAAQPVASTDAMAGPAAGMPINFALGSSRLAPDSMGFVRSVAEVMQSDPEFSLVIEGHTDSTGGYRRNMLLSWERAMGVFRILVEDFGIEPTRLKPVGIGPAQPLPGTSPADGVNRRVQFRRAG